MRANGNKVYGLFNNTRMTLDTANKIQELLKNSNLKNGKETVAFLDKVQDIMAEDPVVQKDATASHKALFEMEDKLEKMHVVDIRNLLTRENIVPERNMRNIYGEGKDQVKSTVFNITPLICLTLPRVNDGEHFGTLSVRSGLDARLYISEQLRETILSAIGDREVYKEPFDKEEQEICEPEREA